MDTIHNMDVVQQLRDARIRNLYDWLWQKQLRFYLENNRAIIKMVDAQFNYTYEYQGNAQKLVHTPLTDKCYLTLTQGMHMGFGGNPVGHVFSFDSFFTEVSFDFSMDPLVREKLNQ
jgi:dynein heavy chain 2